MTKKMSVYKHKSISLSEDERQIVNDFAARLSLTFSGALRIIIREWRSDRDENEKPKNVLQRIWRGG